MARIDKIGKTATKVLNENGFTKVVYHNTAVVKFDQDIIELNSGGWRTNTTKVRMNQASNQFGLGFHVFQRNGDWYVTVENNGQIDELTFGDGMIISR